MTNNTENKRASEIECQFQVDNKITHPNPNKRCYFGCGDKSVMTSCPGNI